MLARNAEGGIWGSDLLPITNRRGQPAYFGNTRVRLTRAEAEQVRDLLHRALERSVGTLRKAADDDSADEPRESYLFVGAVLPTSLSE